MRSDDASLSEGAGAKMKVSADQAPHVTTAFDHRQRRCRAAVESDRGLDHIAHYSGGVYDFDVDILTAARGGKNGSVSADTRRDQCRDVGRRLTFQVSSLDRLLAEVHTGALIRMVIHVDCAMIYCFPITRGEHLVSVTLRPAVPAHGELLPEIVNVRETDVATSDLTTEIRADINLGPQNPGGWLTEKPAKDADLEPAFDLDSGDPAVHYRGDEAAVATCRRFLTPAELSYVAHYRDGVEDYSVDLFDHAAIAHYFTHITSDARRDFYGRIGRDFTLLSRQIA
jgi:hypothetical protein